MAIASMVCGIISICTCWCYGIVGVILAILGIVFYCSYKKSHQGERNGFATAGLACSIIGLILSVLALAWFAYIIANYDKIIDSTSTDTNSFIDSIREFYQNAE